MNRKIVKEIREWIVLIGVISILFFTGWYKDIASLLQRGLLETGFSQPTELAATRPASYDFQLVNMEGEVIPFSSFEGEVIFMNFWATWCPPCIAEMPDIHDLYLKTGKDVNFVMISVDRDQLKAQDFIKRKGFTFPVYFLRGQLPPTYETSSIPSTFIISPAGEVVAEHQGLAKYDTEKFKNFLLQLRESQLPSGNPSSHAQPK